MRLAHDFHIKISRHLDIGGRDQCPFFVAAVVDGGGGVLAGGAETSGVR